MGAVPFPDWWALYISGAWNVREVNLVGPAPRAQSVGRRDLGNRLGRPPWLELQWIPGLAERTSFLRHSPPFSASS